MFSLCLYYDLYGETYVIFHSSSAVVNFLPFSLLISDLFHPQWKGDWEEGGSNPQRRVLPNGRHDELRGEGQSGPEAAFRMICLLT